MLVRCVLMLCLGIVIAGTAMADAIVTSSVPTFDGDLYHYSYTVTNPELPEPPGGLSIWSFQLTFPGAYQDVASPTDWTVFPLADGIQWAVLDLENLTGAIPPGESLSGFGFASPWGPGPVSYEVGFDSFEQVDFLTGTTEGPVPEPATFVLGALGLLGVFSLSRFRRR